MRKASVLILVGLFLTATAPAFARHHHCGNWGNQGWGGGNGYYAPSSFSSYGYAPRQGFLNYLVNGNPPGYSYFGQNGYYRPNMYNQNNGWHRGWYHQDHDGYRGWYGGHHNHHGWRD